jgi:choline dehydrogenase
LDGVGISDRTGQVLSELDCDYIIVGGGSAGCLAAWRLIAGSDAKVILLEVGKEYQGPYLKLTPGYSKLIPKGRHCTIHRTVPQRQLNGRELEIATGRVLGGGSSVNAQVYMRGNASDYDKWGEATGSESWNWQALLPHFRALECNQKFNDEFHGCDGPLQVADPGFVCEYSHLFVKAAQSIGLPFTADFNRGAPKGTGYLQITARGGRRCSAVDAYLDKVRADPRLTVITGAQVNRVVMHNQRAVGVEYLHRGKRLTVRCHREVLLAAGAFESPKLLMLSGIGPADHLRKFNIPVCTALPGVGQNLQDHCGAPIVLQGNALGYGYFRQNRGWRLAANVLEYGLFKRGRMTSVGGEACSFHVGDDGSGESTVQVWCVPTIEYANTAADAVPAVNGLKLHVTLNRPRSKGSLYLRSANPTERPWVDPNYLADGRDLKQLIEGLRTARSIAASAPLNRVISRELQPGVETQSDAELGRYIRGTLRTDWHPVGTCRMGRSDDRMSVVDATLKVFGVQGLRVIDASTMPNIVSANTNAPTMALADRGLSLLLAEANGQDNSLTPNLARSVAGGLHDID